MKPDHFARLKEILLRIADLPEEERALFLDRECARDPDLRREVEKLLAHDPGPLRHLEPRGEAMGAPAESRRAADLSGRVISHYRVETLLGEGGMGLVYRAEDATLGRPVALKFLRPDAVGLGRSRERFIREARAAAALNHPNICTVHAIEEFEGGLFLAMALIEGETLKARLRRGPLPLEEALEIAAQVAAGLVAAHAKGIVHRDIKPTNIMVSPDGRAQLLDFGLARPSGDPEITRSGAVLGTLAYMSPEQAQGGEIDARTDLWSLGVVLFEMLTGRRPFAGDNEPALLYAIVHQSPADVLELRPDLPPGCGPVLGRALAKSREERYGSAEEFQRDLERVRDAPHAPLDRTWRVPGWRPRPRRRIGLAGAGLILALGAGLGLWRLLGSANSPIPPVQSRQITSGTGWEGEPAISPDGSRIAYVAKDATVAADANRSVIAVIDARGGNPLILTQESSDLSSPSWFPDGSRLAFVSDRTGGLAVWQIGQYGGGSTLLIPRAFDPSVSPDGKRIAFARMNASGFSRIFVATVASPSDSAALTHDDDGLWIHRHPAWSPDGRTICYETMQELWLVPSQGGSARRLTAPGNFDLEPAWSPGGRYIYFSSFRGGTRALWRVTSRGEDPSRLTLGTGPEVYPSLCRDGSRLAYSTERDPSTLLIRDRQTGVETRVNNVSNARMPAIAPDGSSLVFVSQRVGSNNDLWLQALLAGTPKGTPQLLNSQAGNSSHPVFSPDGNWIAYYCILEGKRDLWILSARGGPPRRVTSDPGSEIQPAWSPDGRFLAFSSDRSGSHQIWLLPVAAGTEAGPESLLATPGIVAFAPAWSPDGDRIAFVGGRGEERDLWVLPLGGGPPRRLTSGLVVRQLRWDRKDRRILASAGRDHILLYSIPVDGPVVLNGQGIAPSAEPAVDFGRGEWSGYFDASADERWFVYTSDEGARGNIWVLESRTGAL